MSTAYSARLKFPIEVFSEEMVDKIYGIVMEDRRIKFHQIAEMVGISYKRVQNILHEVLKLKKLSLRWVLRFFFDSRPITYEGKRKNI